MRLGILLLIGAFLAACAPKPPAEYSHSIESVEIARGLSIINSFKHYADVAREAGFERKFLPVSSQRPTPAETRERKAIEAHNAEISRFMQRPEVVRAMQDRFIDDLKSAILTVAANPITIPTRNDLSLTMALVEERRPPVLRVAGKPPAKLTIEIGKLFFGVPNTDKFETLGGKALAGIFQRNNTPAYELNVRLTDVNSGTVIRSKRLVYYHDGRVENALKQTQDINLLAALILWDFSR